MSRPLLRDTGSDKPQAGAARHPGSPHSIPRLPQSRDGGRPEYSRPAWGHQPPPLVAEAKRLYLRYAKEVVEALGFCPWAARARQAGQVAVEVLLGEDPTPELVRQHMTTLARRSPIVIGLLVMPEVQRDAVSFQHLAARVREHAVASYGAGQNPWVVADFHPQGALDLTSSDRAVTFIRRTPDPTLQLVRQQVLAKLRRGPGEGTQFVDPSAVDMRCVNAGDPPVSLRRRIATHNWRKLQSLGPEAVQRRLAAIHQDRHRSYARLGVRPAPWAG